MLIIENTEMIGLFREAKKKKITHISSSAKHLIVTF